MITVAVIEDHPVFRQGLALAVEQGAELQLASVHPSVEDFDRTGGILPQVVLLDLHLPGLEGPTAVSYLAGRGVAVLVVSAATARDDVVDAVGAGARGYLGKEANADEIVLAIKVVASGGTYVSATLASYLLHASRVERGPAVLELTPKERQVLGLVARGERDQDIAEQLSISVSTVRSHLDRIRDKTGRRRRADLTRLAVDKGLLGEATNPEKPTPKR